MSITFKEYFFSLVQQIPCGKITTYGSLARALGDVKASRAVGKMLNENPRPIEVPCHRVVMSDGTLGGFGMGVEKKRELLLNEGVHIHNDRILDFEDILFDDFITSKPLKGLRGQEERIKNHICIPISFDLDEVTTVGGVDVSYQEDRAFAALSIWDESSEIYTHTIDMSVDLPYIPSYLSFREMPAILKLLDDSEIIPDILMVDGNGILHPRGIGLATHIGVSRDIPSIGVAKSLLLGKLERDPDHVTPVSKVLHKGKVMGYAYLSSKRAKRPIYVSTGHKINLGSALDIVERYCVYKVPEPIRRAHTIATKAKMSSGDDY